MRRAWGRSLHLDGYTAKTQEALRLLTGEFNPGDTIRVDRAADALTFTPIATAQPSTSAA
jgi:hypothetical protein